MFVILVSAHLEFQGVEPEGRVLLRLGQKADEYHIAVAMGAAIAELALKAERRVRFGVSVHLDLDTQDKTRRWRRGGQFSQKQNTVVQRWSDPGVRLT